MKRILIFFDRPYIDAHFCFKELISHIYRDNYKIHLFLLKDTKVDLTEHPNISTHFYTKGRISTLALMCRLFIYSIISKVIITNPQWPLYIASIIKRISKIGVVCLSDEVYGDSHNSYNIEQSINSKAFSWKIKEIIAHQNSDYTIALGQARYELAFKTNKLPLNHPYSIIPNAPSFELSNRNSNFSKFYQKLSFIRSEDVIILHSGGLLWSMIPTLQKVKFKNSNIKIVLQCRRIYDEILTQNRSIILSEAFIPYNDIVSATRSATIGLMLYDQNNAEEARNGMTAGKLGLYLAAGIPIIFCNLDAFSEYENEGIGIRIDSLDYLEEAINTILLSYDDYQNRVNQYFKNTFEYSKQYQPFRVWLDAFTK